MSERPRGREAKLAHGLEHAGWEVVLLYRTRPAHLDIRRHFRRAHRFSNPWRALAMASHYSPLAYHVFSLAADETASTFVRHKPGPVVFDANDVFGGMDRGISPAIDDLQRTCIENADGMCCRDLQPRVAAQRKGYRLPHIAYLPDGCWATEGLPPPAPRRDGDGIHVVSAGNFGIEKRGQRENGLLEFARLLTEQGIHFHIYAHWFLRNAPAAMLRDELSDYLALGSPFLHLHPAVPMEQLSARLREYDFGLVAHAAHTFGWPHVQHDPARLAACGATRIYDFIDAGVPVITNREVRLTYSQLARYGLCLEATLETLRDARSRLESFRADPELPLRFRRARQAYSVARNIARLVSLYERVAGIT